MFRIVSQAAALKQLTQTLCLESPPLMQFCLQLYNLFYGPHTIFRPVGECYFVELTTFNWAFQETIPVYFTQLPGGTALKILNHAADLVLGNFRKYNYVEQNFKYYGTDEPPVYDIKKIPIPVYVIYSTQDWATTEAVRVSKNWKWLFPLGITHLVKTIVVKRKVFSLEMSWDYISSYFLKPMGVLAFEMQKNANRLDYVIYLFCCCWRKLISQYL